ncbi:MAG: hypothetical protein AAB922_03845 [Patescibacteria group bacterium]
MKFLCGTLIILALGFVSCNSNVESYEIAALEKACKKHGGIHKINTILVNDAVCNDGKRVSQKDAVK